MSGKKKKIKASQRKLKKAVTDKILDYIGQFKGTYFGDVIKIGNPNDFKKAIEQLTIVPNGKVGKNSIAHHKVKGGTLYPVEAEMHIRFNPSKKLTFEQQKTLYHETIHQIEWLHNDKRDKTDPTAERNTDYLDRLVDLLVHWSKSEKQLVDGKSSPAQKMNMFNLLKVEFDKIQKTFSPDFANLRSWTGIYSIPASGGASSSRGIQFKDILNHYRKSDCKALRRLAKISKYHITSGVWKCSRSLKEAAYVGSKNSDKYHMLKCRYVKSIEKKNRICFVSEEAADDYGYSHCETCQA